MKSPKKRRVPGRREDGGRGMDGPESGGNDDDAPTGIPVGSYTTV